MNFYQKNIKFIAFAIFVNLSIYANASSQCDTVFTAPIANLKTEISESSLDNYVNNQLCSEKYDSSSKESKAKMDLAYKVFSVGGRTGSRSVKEYQEKYCHQNTESHSESNFDYLRIQRVSDSALNAWTRCIDLTNRGWDFQFESPSPMTLNFRVSRTQAGTVMLTGVDIHIEDDSLIKCKADVLGVIGDKGIKNIEINQNGWSMSCQRKPSSIKVDGQKYKFYPETNLTVRAEGSVFSYSLPELYKPFAPEKEVKRLLRKTENAEENIEAIYKTIEVLNGSLGQVEERLNESENNIQFITKKINE